MHNLDKITTPQDMWRSNVHDSAHDGIHIHVTHTQSCLKDISATVSMLYAHGWSHAP